MKRFTNSFTNLMMSLTLTLFSQTALAGNGGGNGGHPYAMEFQNHMDTMMEEMDACEIFEDPEVARSVIPTKLDQDISFTEIDVKRRGKLIDKHGKRVAALNFPKKMEIEVLAKEWEKLTGKSQAKRGLVLHEYLGIHDNAEVDTYRLSQYILKEIEICRTTTNKLDKLEVSTQGGLKGVVIATATNRKTKNAIIFSRDEEGVYFYLSKRGLIKQLNSLQVTATASELTLKGKKLYQFKFFKGGARWTSKWIGNYWQDVKLDPTVPVGVFLLGLGAAYNALGTVPFLVGTVAAPIEATVDTFKAIFHKDQIAKRKFGRLVRGKYVKSSDKVFTLMVKQIQKL